MAREFELKLGQQIKDFATKLLTQLADAGFSDEFTEIDHVCYRVPSLEIYEFWKKQLGSCASLLSEAFINGRPIATYKLDKAIRISPDFSINVLELPAPRADAIYSEGFEHLEVLTKSPLEDLLSRYGHYSFKTHNLSAKINRDISLRFDAGLVKFHEKSLENIIALEKKSFTAKTKRPLVLFDFDDTILVTRELFLKTVHLALEKYFTKPIDLSEIQAKARPIFPEFFANFGIKDSSEIKRILAAFKEEWQTHSAQYVVPTGIRTVLSCLRSEGVETQIWTARDQATTISTLEEIGLAEFFSAIHAYDGMNTSKPIPTQELELACKQASQLFMIGDSPADFSGAAAIAAKFLQAAWIHKVELNLPESQICTGPLEALNRIMAYIVKTRL